MIRTTAGCAISTARTTGLLTLPPGISNVCADATPPLINRLTTTIMLLIHSIDSIFMRTGVFINLSIYLYLRFVLLTHARKDEAHEKLLIMIKSIIPQIVAY